MAVISKGIKLSYGAGEAFTPLTDLQEIPSLGGTTESIEITTLADAAHMYTDGIKNYGDSLAFKFLYAKEQFETLSWIHDVNLPIIAIGGSARNVAQVHQQQIDYPISGKIKGYKK